MRQSLIIFAAILLVSLPAFAQQSRFEIKPEGAPPVIDIFPDWPDDAALIIYSSIPNLQFKSNIGGIRHITSEPDKYKIIIETEKQSITVQKPGFRESSILVPKLNPKDVRYFVIEEMSDSTKSFPIIIQSSPKNARIYIDGELKGTKQSQMVPPGPHKIHLELDGYRYLDTNITASLNNTLFEFVLEKLVPTQVTIKTVPEAATVFIYDKKNNRVNKTGQEQTNLQIFLTEGTYKMRISKLGFAEIDTIFSVVQKVKKELVYDLLKEAARLTIVLSPADAKLEIDGKVYEDTRNIELTPGMHLIDINKEGYEPFYEAVDIQRNQQLTKTVTLVPVFGSLQMTIQPIEAKVKLLKNSKVISEWTGSNIIDTLTTGTYELQASAVGYKNFSDKDIIIEKDKIFNKDIKLEKQEYAGLQITKITSPDRVLSNMNFREEAGKYYITYDLAGDPAEEYTIELYLMNGSDSGFEKKLVELTGEVNTGKYSGKSRQIVWNYLKEFPGKFSMGNLYLKLTAEKAGGGIPWYYFAGAAVVGGGVYFLVSKKADTTTDIPTAPASTIPDQPGRP